MDRALLNQLLEWFPLLVLLAVWVFFMRQVQNTKTGLKLQ
jgi:hypothetical protein